MGIAQQRTLGAAVGCSGVGLHSGRPVTMTLRPGNPGTGIIFRRLDAGAEIQARWDRTVESALSTVLSNGEGIQVGTIEHLMAAFAGAEIDNAIVEIDGPEVPIMDGSAAPFVRLIDDAGISVQDAMRRAIKVLKPVVVNDNGAVAALLPDHGFTMSFEIDYDNPLIRQQDLQLVFEPGTFENELSRARSFCLFDDVDRMRACGLALGGSLDNAVVVRGNRILNTGGLRFADEFVRHKLLDAYGDLYLAGGPLIGHFTGTRSGHALTRRLLAALFADPASWCETTLAETGTMEAVVWPEARRAVRA
ncbi:MAG TPA: UDP-3-O-acyl-N-acetylglucosamine deacetylase [Stellaceae bacterium]|nr:UDP-3-O-acyl-N-acetylglucosamine deacetylase [Stellaceae bacterium]